MAHHLPGGGQNPLPFRGQPLLFPGQIELGRKCLPHRIGKNPLCFGEFAPLCQIGKGGECRLRTVHAIGEELPIRKSGCFHDFHKL